MVVKAENTSGVSPIRFVTLLKLEKRTSTTPIGVAANPRTRDDS